MGHRGWEFVATDLVDDVDHFRTVITSVQVSPGELLDVVSTLRLLLEQLKLKLL